MPIAELFAHYAADFELTFLDDDWQRLVKYFAQDAAYVTRGQRASRHDGRDALLATLRRNVSNFDRRCDSRRLTTVDGPQIDGDVLTRTWQCRFTAGRAPALEITGLERATYRGKEIVLLEETIVPASAVAMNAWLADHSGELKAAG